MSEKERENAGNVINDPDDEGEMEWELRARQAVERAAETIEKDEIRGVIYMDDSEDPRGRPVRGEFTDWEDVMYALTSIGEGEWVGYAPFDGGEPVFEPNVDGYVQDAMSEYEVEQFFAAVAPPPAGEELIDTHDLVAHRAGLVIQVDLEEINEELVRHLAKHPEKMHALNPRTFEQLIAELFKDKGYDVELTPKTKDGGFDVRAFRREDVGTCLTLIECKRYAPTLPVSVEIVRGLYGVSMSEGATNGIIATTSHFTKGAKSFQAQNKYKLHLADFDNVKVWLETYKKGR
jgi:Restriction endonuclease